MSAESDASLDEGGPRITRRAALGLCIASLAAPACRGQAGATGAPESAASRLLARPGPPRAAPPPAGTSSLGLAAGRDASIHLPAGYRADSPAPLVLLLHGAGGSARGGLAPLLPFADDAGLVLLAPDSRGTTWDFLRGAYGPDVAFIDRALAWTFARLAVDPARLAIGGFSDGASYALSLGLTNGDLFARVVAFSPCVLAPTAYRGRPRVFVSHGTSDEVLPIDACSRAIVPALRRTGYDVTYREFDGPHTVPAEIARAAVDWLASDGARR
ncbi:MAG: alpha/beta hydrolase [Gemmatimonadaceae bacterium]